MVTREIVFLLVSIPVFAQLPDYGQDWLPEFNHASEPPWSQK